MLLGLRVGGSAFRGLGLGFNGSEVLDFGGLGLTDPPSTKSWVGLGPHQLKGTTQFVFPKEP